MRTGAGRALVLAAGMGLALAARAETAWVTDKLLLGLHQSKSASSTILQVVPSGTALDVIERDGAFAHVRTPSGAEGWVDAAYLVSDKPSIVLLQEAQDARAKTEKQLAAAQSRVVELQHQLAAAQNAYQALKDERAATPARTVLKAQDKPETTAPNSEALRDVQRVAIENQRLKTQLAHARAAVQRSTARVKALQRAAANAPHAPVWSGLDLRDVFAWRPWQWLLLGSVLLLAFAAGGYLVDWNMRRRHGGFRV